MPFIDNNTSSLLFKSKYSHVVKNTLICSTALASIMIANPLTKTTVKADAVPTTQVNTPTAQINTPTTNWVATKPIDIHIDNDQKTYTLNSGDTLWAIAQATNTDVNQLAQLNNINLEAGDQYHLAIGLTINLTTDAQTENNNDNSSDNANTAAQNSATSNNSSDNAESTAANNSDTAETPATANSNSAAQTTSQAETSPQNSSADTAATGNQAENKNSNADDASNAGNDTNADTTKNGQIDTGKSQVSKPADVIHNESGTNTSDEPSSQPAVSQSGILSDGSTNSQTPSSPADKTSSNKPTADSSQHSAPSSSTDNTSNDNKGDTASSSANNNSSAPANSSSKPTSSSVSNVGSGPVDINRGANHSSSSSSSNNHDSSSSSSSSDNNPNDTINMSNYKQTAPLNNNDLAKVVTLEKQINDLRTQANTIDNNLQFYQEFINATKNANGTNPQDRLEKIAFQDTYYQKTVNGYSDMSDEQARLNTIKAQLPIDDQLITNLQNQLTKPDITDNKKQTLTTDLNNAKATAVKDQETYQTLQAKISLAPEIVSQYKAFLTRNADMTAALKGNNQADSLVTQYQKYINDNQNTQASLNTQITDIKNQLKAYGVTLNS